MSECKCRENLKPVFHLSILEVDNGFLIQTQQGYGMRNSKSWVAENMENLTTLIEEIYEEKQHEN